MQNILDGYYGFDENYPGGIYIADSNGKLMKASESDKSESDVTGSVCTKKDLQGLILRWVQHTKILREKMLSVHRL